MRDSRSILSRLRTFVQSPGRSIYNKLHKRYNAGGVQPGADEGNLGEHPYYHNLTRLDKYLARLIKEWAEHGKIIVAIDVDDTVLPFRTATQAECDAIIELVKECQRVGAYIIIYSCRDESGLEGAVKYLADKGLRVDAINKNPIKLPYGNSAKPYANIFLDDRAGLPHAVDMLKEAMYRQRAKQWSERLDYPGAAG